jgi:hypothetical protein
MIKYFPLTRVRTNLYTRGNEYLTPDRKSYAGRYYVTYEDKAYTGISPVLGANTPLTPIGKANVTDEYVSDFTGNSTSNTLRVTSATGYAATGPQVDPNAQLTSLNPYYPVPLDSDYTRGYFTRYFAKDVSGPGFVIEISQLDWTKIQNGDISDTVLGYQSTSMLWQLTGPLNNTRVSQYQVKGGVFDTNKRVTEAKQKTFRGIVEFIGGDYIKFAKITP